MIPLLLIALAAVCVGWLPGRLTRAAWPARAPRLGILAGLTVAFTGLLSVVLTGVTLVVLWRDTHHLLRNTWQFCVDALSGAHGQVACISAISGLVLLGLVGLRLAAGAWPVAVTGPRRRRSHAEALDLLGSPSTEPDLTVFPHPAPSAYALPGRRPRIVITTGALAALDREQADAVLAHERAHMCGRHHRLIVPVQILAAAFSRVRPLRSLERLIARLIEMRADDVAVRQHPRLTLARALVAMATAGATMHGPAPVGTLHAAGSDVSQRLNRLLYPPPRLGVASRVAIVTAVVALAAAPVVLVVLRPVLA